MEEDGHSGGLNVTLHGWKILFTSYGILSLSMDRRYLLLKFLSYCHDSSKYNFLNYVLF